jgi:CelD/BcsL family acetyltransferase involved in cellulose biosynthesis
MEVVFSTDGRDFRRQDWSGLVAGDPEGTFFHIPRYLKLYWEEFGDEAELLLSFGAEDGEVLGAAAFERIGTELRFLGGTEVTDYMGPVAAPGAEDALAKELVAALARRDDWSRADLRGLPEGSRWLERLSQAAADAGLSVERGEDGVAPLLLLAGSYEEYLAGLPIKLRHEIGRKSRRLAAEAGRYRVVLATEESLGADLDRFVALHRASEGPKGKFMQPGMEIFFRRLGEAFLPDRIFRLAFLEIEGHRVAGAIGFSFRETFYLYNSAFDREWSRLSPGMVLVAELIRQAIAEGCTRFDMLKGDLAYKYRFGAIPRTIRRLSISRP